MDNKGYTEKLTDTANMDNTDKMANSGNTGGVDAAKNVFIAYNIEHTEKMADTENVASTESAASIDNTASTDNIAGTENATGIDKETGTASASGIGNGSITESMVSTEKNDVEVRSEYADSSLENENINSVDNKNKKKIDIALLEENELDKLKGAVKGYSVRLLTDKLLEKGFVGDNMSHIVDNSTLFNQIKECNASGLPVVGFFRKKKMFGCFIFEKITIKKDSLEPIPDIDTDTLNIIRIKNCYVHEDAKNVEAEMLEVAHHDAYTVLTESMMDGSDKNKFDGLTWNNLVYIVKKDKKNGGYLAGLPIGIALGIIYGMLFENLILGICIGLCLGMCFGMSYGNIFGSTGYRLVVNTEEKDTLKDE